MLLDRHLYCKGNHFNFRLWQVPYYWMGIKAYDFVSGSECLKSSYYLSKEHALELFPMLKRDRLKGAIVYYDGGLICIFNGFVLT